MRVLHVINDAQVGGAQTLVENLARQREPGDEVRLIVLLGPDTVTERYASAFDAVHYLRLARRRPNVFGALVRMRQLIAAFDPDVVHSHLEQSDLLTELVPTGRAVRISTVHTSGYTRENPRATRFIARVVARWSRRFDAVIASDSSSLPFMRETGYRREAVVIRNGVAVPDTAEYDRASRTFVCLARWHHMKGYPQLISAFGAFAAEHPGWRLACAGSDVSRRTSGLGELLDALPADISARIDLLGALADVQPVLARAAALVVASTHGETFTLVGMEAAARAVPVIATDVGGLRAFVLHAGLLVRPGSTQDLTRALTAFAALDDDERATLAQESRQLAVERFSIASTARAYREVYEQALEAHRIRARRR